MTGRRKSVRATREQARNAAEKRARNAAENRARNAAETQARNAAENRARNAAETQARNAAENRARNAAETQARNAAENRARNAASQQRNTAETQAQNAGMNEARNAEENQARSAEVNQARNAHDNQERNVKDNQEGIANDNQEKNTDKNQTQNAGEIQERNAEDDQERNAEDNQERNIEDNQERNAEDNQERNAEDNQEQNTEDNQERNIEDNQEQNAEDNQARNAEDNQERNAEDNQARNAEDKQAGNAKDNQVRNAGEIQEMNSDECQESSEDENQARNAEDQDLETPSDSLMSEKEPCESSDSDDRSVRSLPDTADTSDDEKQNGGAFPSEDDGEKENQCPDAAANGGLAKDYRCKYCAFTTTDLRDFKEHVDAHHPDVILNPMYRCVSCGFSTKKFESLTQHNDQRHPSHAHFTFKKKRVDDQTVLEQEVEARARTSEELTSEELTSEELTSEELTSEELTGEELTSEERTVNGSEPTDATLTSEDTASEERTAGDGVSGVTPAATAASSDSFPLLEQIRAVSINGTVIVPDAAALHESPHVSPTLQRPPNLSREPKVAVPLHTAKYDPALDDNATLMASFSRFPYPTHAELSWLTAASRVPEEQIRVWFTTQRLKRGITWAPEEVEEARKKMFNGSVLTPHVLLSTAAVSTPTVRTTTNSPSALKRTIATASGSGPEPKRPIMAVAPNPGEKGLMAPPPLPLKPTLDAKRAVPLTPLKNKPNLPNSRTWPFVSMVFPESLTRRTIAPAPFSTPPFKGNILIPRKNDKVPISLPNGSLTNSAPLIPPQIRRPAIIQSIHGNNIGFPALDATKEHNFDANKASYGGLEANKASYGGLEANKASYGGLEANKASYGGLEANKASYGGLEANKASYGGLEANKASYGKWAEPLEEPQSDLQQRAQVLTQFPLLERMKGKTAEQLKVLEENFLRNSFPTLGAVETLAATTRLSPSEIDSWFSERRALRDNLEQALLNSMGTRRNGHAHSAMNGHAPCSPLENGHKGAGLVSRGSEAEPVASRWSFVDDLTQRWFHADPAGGKTGSALPGPDLIGPHCPDSTNGSNGRAQEAESNWYKTSLGGQPPHDRYNRSEFGTIFGRWIERRHDLSEES